MGARAGRNGGVSPKGRGNDSIQVFFVTGHSTGGVVAADGEVGGDGITFYFYAGRLVSIVIGSKYYLNIIGDCLGLFMAQRGKARVPTEAEIKRLLTVTKVGCNARRNIAILAASYRLGLRAKEMAALTVGDVSDEAGQLREECSLSAAQTKGGKPRMVYLTNQAVRSALNDYLRERSDAEHGMVHRESALFRSTKGGGFSSNTMQQLLHKLHERAGIIGGRSHSGRRHFATSLIGKGVDLKSVSVLMGHSSVAMTAHYAEDNPHRLRRIVAELA